MGDNLLSCRGSTDVRSGTYGGGAQDLKANLAKRARQGEDAEATGQTSVRWPEVQMADRTSRLLSFCPSGALRYPCRGVVVASCSVMVIRRRHYLHHQPQQDKQVVYYVCHLSHLTTQQAGSA